MNNYNYQKAYYTQVLPAFEAMNEEQHKALSDLLPLVGELHQEQKTLNITISPEIGDILEKLSTPEIATLSRASYFVGHYQPSLIKAPFDNKKGKSWKIANVCDQILRERLNTPNNILIHQGMLRVTFSNRNCWLWDEFGLATEKNLETFKKSKLQFGEDTIENSAQILKDTIGDMWGNPDDEPDNKAYLEYLDKDKSQKIENVKRRIEKRVQAAKDDIESSKHELKALLWLIDKDIDIENCIYYSHVGEYCFGWRNPLTDEEKEILTAKLSDFPYKWKFASK